MADLFGFLSTPSVRRATGFHHGMRCAAKISIHALREEGDDGLLLLAFALEQFLSTPSVRRATRFQALPQGISRHFYPRPPGGGRLRPRRAREAPGKFLSTPSVRRATIYRQLSDICISIFLSTPSVRRATFWLVCQAGIWTFLSTPSVRRATAKTEKNISAFVSV